MSGGEYNRGSLTRLDVHVAQGNSLQSKRHPSRNNDASRSSRVSTHVAASGPRGHGAVAVVASSSLSGVVRFENEPCRRERASTRPPPPPPLQNSSTAPRFVVGPLTSRNDTHRINPPAASHGSSHRLLLPFLAMATAERAPEQLAPPPPPPERAMGFAERAVAAAGAAVVSAVLVNPLDVAKVCAAPLTPYHLANCHAPASLSARTKRIVLRVRGSRHFPAPWRGF